MSKYTTQLLEIVRAFTPDMRFENLSKRVEKARPMIFNFDYPIWTEEHRKILETKIISHYINYEIGLETVPLWQFYLANRMNEIMPYYNEMYESIYPYKDKLYWNKDTTDKFNENETTKSEDIYQGISTGESTEDYQRARNLTDNKDYTRDNSETRDNTGTTTNDLKEQNDGTAQKSETSNKSSETTTTGTRTDDLTEKLTSTDSITDTESTEVNVTRNDTRTDDLTETTKNTMTRDETANSKTVTENLQIVSDLPQTTLRGLDYATQSTQDNGSSTTDSTLNINQTDNGTKDNTGTVKNNGTEQSKGDITKTHDQTQSDTTTNTGTVKNVNDETYTDETTNTGNETTQNIKTNTGTVDTVGNEKLQQNIIDNEKFTSAEGIKDNTGRTSQVNDNTTRNINLNKGHEYQLLRTGLDGNSYSQLIADYLPQIQNIDMMIIKDLKNLFMLIF